MKKLLFQKRSIGLALIISFIVMFGCRDLLASPKKLRYYSKRSFQTPSKKVDPAKAFLELDFQNSFGNTAGKVRSYKHFPIVSVLSLSPMPDMLDIREDNGRKEEAHSGSRYLTGGTILSAVIGAGIGMGVGYLISEHAPYLLPLRRWYWHGCRSKDDIVVGIGILGGIGGGVGGYFLGKKAANGSTVAKTFILWETVFVIPVAIGGYGALIAAAMSCLN